MNGYKGMCISRGKFLKPWQLTDKNYWVNFYASLWVTLTQKIIADRVSKIHKWFWGDVYEWEESFLSHDKWQRNIIEWIFFPIHIQHLYEWLLTQKIITHRVSKIHEWFWGNVYEAGEKFLKPWQVTDKIIEWIFSQFTFNILWVTLTQKIITHRVSKMHDWFWGDVYEWEKVS